MSRPNEGCPPRKWDGQWRAGWNRCECGAKLMLTFSADGSRWGDTLRARPDAAKTHGLVMARKAKARGG
jgi:hypothetical protein